MHVSQLFAITLASASMVGTTVSAAGLPPNANRNNRDVLSKRQDNASGFPLPTSEQQDELMKLYKVANTVKSIKEFNEVVSKAPPNEVLGTLAKKLGGGATASKVRGALNSFPGQPQNVVFSFVSGIGECLIQGKSFTEAIECGKNQVRQLGDNRSIDVPKACNNRLGQLELFGTGWPAPCHDPNIKEHPAGNEPKRAILRFFCNIGGKVGTDRTGGRKQTCDEKFPSDAQIADKAQREELEKKLEQLRIDLLSHLKQVQDKLNKGGKVEQSDIDKAEQLIDQGAFPMVKGTASDMANWCMSNLRPSSGSSQGQQEWATKDKLSAREMPINEADSEIAYLLIRSGLLRSDKGLFQKDGSLQESDICFSSKALQFWTEEKDRETKLYEGGFDVFPALFDVVDQFMRPLQRDCKACKTNGQWVVKCGSTAVN